MDNSLLDYFADNHFIFYIYQAVVILHSLKHDIFLFLSPFGESTRRGIEVEGFGEANLMKKQILLSLFVALFATYTYSQTLSLDGVVFSLDTLENHQIGPGTHYTSLRLMGNVRLDVFFIKADLKNPYVEFRNILSRDSIYGVEQPSAAAKRKSTEGAFYFAGTNGDFYNTTDYIGWPIGGNMVNSEIAKLPQARNLFAIDKHKIPDIGFMTSKTTVKFGENTWTINSINHTRGENRLVLYNQHNGKVTRTNEYGTEVLIELQNGDVWATNKPLKAKVLQIEKNKGSMAIPQGKAVLSGHGTAATNLNTLSVGDEIEINLNLTLNGNTTAQYTQMTAGDNYETMLLNGVVEQTSIWDERHPRTGLGFTQNRDTLIFCIIDGRSASAGVTTKHLAQIMKSAGAYTAVNMDGGGSSAMYIAEYGKPVNQVSDGNERAVGNSVFVVATSPTDNTVGVIMPYKKSISIPRYAEYTPQFRGYNQYEVLLESDVQGVELSCPPTLGTIAGNKFIATGTEPGMITATYNGNVTATINVNFIPASDIQIRLDSIIVDNRTGYPIEVVASTTVGDLPISPQALSWTVEDTDICVVDESGVLKALKSGITTVYGELDGVRDEVKIKAEVPASPVLIADDFSSDSWTVTASASLNAKLTKENLPAAWEHGAAVNIVLNAGRNLYIRLQNEKLSFYSLPDTIRFVVNVGDMSISGGMVSIRANNSSKDVVANFGALAKNKDINIDIPVKNYLDIFDRGIYPIWLNYINFLLGTDMTEKQTYTLSLKEVLSVYEGVSSTGFSMVKGTIFNVYPNPITDNVVFIQPKNTSAQTVKAELYNVSGQMLRSENVGTPKSGLINFSIGDVEKGTYFLKIYQGQESETVKLIK